MSTATVAVLYGAVPADALADEQDSLVQADAVAEALRREGWQPVGVPITLDLAAAAARLQALAPAFVFNLVDAIEGQGCFIHLAPTLIESLGLVHTGASADAITQTQNKLPAKRVMAAAGIPTPEWIEPEHLDAPVRPIGAAHIVKSSWEHASIGLAADSIVTTQAALRRIVADRRRRFGGTWYAERYIEGRELSLSLVGPAASPVVLPASEILFIDLPPGRPRIVDYVAKWHTESPEYRSTPRCFVEDPADRPLLARLEAIARRCWAEFRLSGYVRIDFRIDAEGCPFVLEINTNPCLAPDAGLAATAGRAGWSYDRLIHAILEAAAIQAVQQVAAE
ncbi:MAG: D-alanine--D-alanine ligase [Proteobacteria bacterium]|nr:D-alanine--D-alanine ligase [Pseudomonadota bacterium]MBI3499156.1 D-alanine--D-alanine ligase [Pseudomonadota bacterium]